MELIRIFASAQKKWILKISLYRYKTLSLPHHGKVYTEKKIVSLRRRTLRECVNSTNFIFLLNATLVYVRLLMNMFTKDRVHPMSGPISFAILY